MSAFNNIQGIYYDGQTSRYQGCTLNINANGIISIEGIALDGCEFNALEIRPRVGNTARVIGLPQGGFFETKDNDAVDAALRLHGRNQRSLLPHKLEKNFYYISLSVVFLAAISFIFVAYGLPAISEKIAYSLPPEFSAELAQGTLEKLDEDYFTNTEITLERQKEIQQLFSQNLPAETKFDYKLYFRNGKSIGANAFSLPNGSIIITDELIELADNDIQILAILYHEMGHVLHRHSMRTAIENVGLTVFFAWLMNDIETATDWIAILPTVLVHSRYSRTHEWQADSYALKQMLAHQHDPNHFSNIMEKLTGLEATTQEKTADEAQGQPKKPDDKISILLDFISTHPPTPERIQRFREAQN